MLVTALAFVPSGVALLDTTVSPQTSSSEAPVATPQGNELAPVYGAVDDAKELIDELLACQVLVKVPVTLVYADVLDTRDQHGAFLLDKELENVVDTINIPIYETVTETIWSPSGLLGFLQPITKEVTSIIGYDTEEITETIPVELAVRLDWTEEYLDFSDPHRLAIYLPLPVGLPFVDQGGVVETTCEEVDFYNKMPSFSRDGHDMLFVYIGTEKMAEHLDGWYMDFFTVDVSLATGDDFDLPRGIAFCTSSLVARAEAEANAYMNGVDPEVARHMADPTQYKSEAEMAQDSVEVQGGEAITVPASTMGFLALVGSVVIAAVGLVAYKRLNKE